MPRDLPSSKKSTPPAISLLVDAHYGDTCRQFNDLDTKFIQRRQRRVSDAAASIAASHQIRRLKRTEIISSST